MPEVQIRKRLSLVEEIFTRAAPSQASRCAGRQHWW
jgi:hypothetical protein